MKGFLAAEIASADVLPAFPPAPDKFDELHMMS